MSDQNKERDELCQKYSVEVWARSWDHAVDKLIAMRTDVTQLKQELIGCVAHTLKLQAERAELVSALKKITKADAPYSTKEPGVSRLKHCVAIARDALKKVDEI